MRSTYSYNAFLLPSTARIKNIDNDVVKALMQATIKSRDKGIAKKGQKKLQALFLIIPFHWMIMRNAWGFQTKLEILAHHDPPPDNKNAEKVADMENTVSNLPTDNQGQALKGGY